ncbi:hypothetical protein [Massilia niabensis]|uniref:SMP-30/Gluconolactonase/LRE-like region domain-containing protein n=1 Tax=Massilia niabensis TaxID=544910 RepID=A0ABW0L1U9_9BURK
MNTKRIIKPMEIALAVAVLGLMGGCGGGGGGGDGGSSGTTPPTGVTPPTAIQFGLGGTVTGLAPGTAVTLANGTETVQVANNGTFTFGTKLNAGTAFNIKATPTGGYTCRVTEGTGTIAAADSTKTAVACAPVLLAGTITALQEPQGVAADTAGNLYVLDGGPHAILKIAPSGAVTTLAGGSGKPGLVDGQGAAARFRFGFASDVLVDPQGNLFVSDDCNGAIRKVTPGGLVTTLAGNGSAVCNNVAPATPSISADGTGNAARFERPQRMVFDGQGGVFVLDAAARASVRRVTAAGVVTTTTYATPSGLTAPPSFYGIARGNDGTLYFSDFESRIWKDVGGTLVLHAGGASGVPLDGTGAQARFGALTDMVVGTDGNLYVGDASMVRRVTPAGVVTTLAGSMTRGFADGVGTAARFSSVRSIGFDGTNVIVLDNDQGALRRVSMDGTVSTLSATPALRGHVDGVGAAARFNWSSSLSADADGSLYVADSIAHVVRKTTPDGNVTTIAGRAGIAGVTDSAAGVPLFNEPLSVAAGRDGSIWVAQTVGLRRILNGTVTTVDRDLRANNLFVEADGNAVVTSNGQVPGNGLVQRVTPAGAKTELVNKAKIEALLKTTVARFAPQSVVADAAGNLYISDTGTVAVYKLTKAGELSVFAGTPLKEAGDVEGAAGTATLGFYEVEYMTIDEAGNLYLSGQGGVRKISPTGVVSSPAFDWGNASIGAVTYAKGRLYGMTRYAILQSDTK